MMPTGIFRSAFSYSGRSLACPANHHLGCRVTVRGAGALSVDILRIIQRDRKCDNHFCYVFTSNFIKFKYLFSPCPLPPWEKGLILINRRHTQTNTDFFLDRINKIFRIINYCPLTLTLSRKGRRDCVLPTARG